MFRSLFAYILFVLVLSCLSGCIQSNKRLEQALDGIHDVQRAVRFNSKLLQSNNSELERSLENQRQLQLEVGELKSVVADLRQAQKSVNTIANPVSSVVASAQFEAISLDDQKSIVGRVEWLWLPELQRYFAAQLNTVLSTSMIYADDIQPFERNGKRWLRFGIERAEWRSTVEARVLGQTKVAYLGDDKAFRGTLIALPIILGGFADEIEFVVVQKKKSYPQIVLGKNYLTDVAAVDVALKYTVKKRSDFESLEKLRHQAYVEGSVQKIVEGHGGISSGIEK